MEKFEIYIYDSNKMKLNVYVYDYETVGSADEFMGK
jgi:hypothetical protein